jgi:hypothetical protein
VFHFICQCYLLISAMDFLDLLPQEPEEFDFLDLLPPLLAVAPAPPVQQAQAKAKPKAKPKAKAARLRAFKRSDKRTADEHLHWSERLHSAKRTKTSERKADVAQQTLVAISEVVNKFASETPLLIV